MVERFNDDFIETRRKALHKFLNRIADHPTLTFNEDFKIFLTAEAWVKNFNLYSYNPSVFVHVVSRLYTSSIYIFKSGSSNLELRWSFKHLRNILQIQPCIRSTYEHYENNIPFSHIHPHISLGS